MSSKPPKSATQIDEELAAFTDRILTGQPAKGADTDELRSLENTILQVKSMRKDSSPEALMQRIDKQLINEWNKNPSPLENEPSLWRKFLPGSQFWKVQPRRGLALAVLSILFFLMVVLPI